MQSFARTTIGDGILKFQEMHPEKILYYCSGILNISGGLTYDRQVCGVNMRTQKYTYLLIG